MIQEQDSVGLASLILPFRWPCIAEGNTKNDGRMRIIPPGDGMGIAGQGRRGSGSCLQAVLPEQIAGCCNDKQPNGPEQHTVVLAGTALMRQNRRRTTDGRRVLSRLPRLRCCGVPPWLLLASHCFTVDTVRPARLGRWCRPRQRGYCSSESTGRCPGPRSTLRSR